MRFWIIVMGGLLGAGAAQAQGAEEHYATVDGWEIAAEPARNLCKMYRYYGSSADDHTEGLTVRYDAAKEGAWLTWSTDGPTLFPGDGRIDLYLNFVKGESFDESWGSRTFRHGKPEETRFFMHLFDGPGEARRLLGDLAASEIIGLYLGPTMLTALKLDAAEATESMRECALKIAARASAEPLPQ